MPFSPKNTVPLPVAGLRLATGLAHGQTNFNNASFEGSPGAGVTPPGWSNCYGTPDVLPGVWGVTLAPASGNTYIGLANTTSAYKEAVGQPFAFTAGVTYTFSINLARSTTYQDPATTLAAGSMCGQVRQVAPKHNYSGHRR
jgi:hypothetical protein